MDIVQTLCSAQAKPNGRRFYTVPSTPQTTQIGFDSGEHRFVCSKTPGCLSTTQLLAKLANGISGNCDVICFSDQMTSALDSPVFVRYASADFYLPAVEIIARRRYEFELHVWTGTRFEQLPDMATDVDVLRLVHRYLLACDRLGQGWLARAEQQERFHTARAQSASHRLRAFHSALMHAFADCDLPAALLHLTQRMLELETAHNVSARC